MYRLKYNNSPSFLYGCETWSLTLREEHKLRVFENRVLTRIFGQKRGEVTRKLGKLHSEELNNLYSSPDVIRQIKSRRMKCVARVACMGEESVPGFGGKASRNCCSVLSLSRADSPNVQLLRDISPVLDEGVLYTEL
jgi:hypothetical protein